MRMQSTAKKCYIAKALVITQAYAEEVYIIDVKWAYEVKYFVHYMVISKRIEKRELGWNF